MSGHHFITRNSVLSALSRHIGERNGVSVENLTDELGGWHGARRWRQKAEERRVRKRIEELRREGVHICATPESGYFIAETSEELQATCRFLFARAMTSLKQVAAMKNISLPDLEGQLKLKT